MSSPPTTSPTPRGAAPAAEPIGAWAAFRIAVREPRSLFAILAIVCSHTVMVGVMVMTPVHMTAHGLSLSLVGVVISIHIIGMYGASPLVGWLADRIGSPRVIAIGVGILTTAALIGILAPADDMLARAARARPARPRLVGGLIGGSTLLTTSVEPSDPRAAAGRDGCRDEPRGRGIRCAVGRGAGGGGFAGVNVVALLVLVPLVVLGVRAQRAR